MRIQMVLPGLGVAGMERMALSLAAGLRKRGHDVGFTCTNALGPLATEPAAGRVTLVRPWLPGSALLPLRLARHLRLSAPDLVHVHNAPWLKAARASRLAGIPVVQTLHGLPARLSARQARLMKAGARLTDEIVAVSEPLGQFAMTRLGVPLSRIRIIPNGIDVDEPVGREATLRPALRLPPQARLVGIVARFDPVKDHPTLLKAFVHVVAALPDVHLILIGEGREAGRIRRLIEELSLGGRVHLLGVRNDVQSLLRELDVVALSSSSEGLPLSLLEAMAASRPIVSTAVGDIPGLLEGGAGTVVPPGDPVGLGTSLVQVLSSPELMATMGRRARERVAERYGLDTMVSKYEQFYRQVLASRAQVP